MDEPIVQGKWITPNQKLHDALKEFNEIKIKTGKLSTIHEQIEKAMQSVKDAHYTLASSINVIKGLTGLPGYGLKAKHPLSNHTGDMFSIIMDLNDCEHWTREQIADWIETLDIDTTFKTEYNETQPDKEKS